jgi:hypothetical protein
MTEISDDFLAAVRELVEGAHAFLINDDGCDEKYIDIMNGGVVDVLKTARKIPALRDWASKFDADAIAPRLAANIA